MARCNFTARTAYGVARLFFGLGTTVWIGRGGGVFIRINYLSVRTVDYSNTKVRRSDRPHTQAHADNRRSVFEPNGRVEWQAIITVSNQTLGKTDLKKNWIFR
jgi:hypothetical protein